MNIGHKWKRLLAIGCSHGTLIDPTASAAVMGMRDAWKPQTVIHLGDWCDTAALRAGAKGNEDEAKPLTPDIDAGLDFLRDMGVTHCTMGNHDERPYRFLNHPTTIIRELAQSLVAGIEDRMKKQHIQWLNQWNVFKHFEIGGVKWMHGYMFTENAARDHAEAHGAVVFAHTHTTMLQKGRRDDNPTGICVGTLARISNMDYAKARRKTLSWSQGFVWGEHTDTQCVLWLHEQGRNEDKKPWRLPV